MVASETDGICGKDIDLYIFKFFNIFLVKFTKLNNVTATKLKIELYQVII